MNTRYKEFERRKVFEWKKKEIISAEEKEAYFLNLDITMQGLKEELSKSRIVASKNEGIIREELRIFRERFRNVVFQRLADKIDVSGDEISRKNLFCLFVHIKDAVFFDSEMMRRDAIVKFVDDFRFDKISKLVFDLAQRQFDLDTRRHTLFKQEIMQIIDINDEEFEEYINIFSAFGILTEVSSSNGKYSTEEHDICQNMKARFSSVAAIRQGG